MQLWIWRGFRIGVPADWEMLQFSREARVGRCAFADRYQFRLELDWRVVPGPPDFERMMSGYRARLLEQGMKDVRSLSHGAWQGVGCEGVDGISTRFGRHFPGAGCLLELVFLWRGERDAQAERGILDSVAEEPAQDGGLRRWRAFGLDLRVPAGSVLDRCVVAPARAEMFFTEAGGRCAECFARRGMVGEWLTGTVESWLQSRVPRDVAADPAGTCDVAAGHAVAAVRGTQRAVGLRGLWGPRPRYEAAAWICPADGRLYFMSRTGDSGETGGRDVLAGNRLTCCAGLERAGGRA